MQSSTLHQLGKPIQLPTNRTDAMKVKMFVCEKDVEVELKLDTKALGCDGVKADGHSDRINEDPEKHYLLAIFEL